MSEVYACMRACMGASKPVCMPVYEVQKYYRVPRKSLRVCERSIRVEHDCASSSPVSSKRPTQVHVKWQCFQFPESHRPLDVDKQ